MAGYQIGQRISGQRRPNRSRRRRPVDGSRQLPVGDQRARSYVEQGAPDTHLKGGPSHTGAQGRPTVDGPREGLRRDGGCRNVIAPERRFRPVESKSGQCRRPFAGFDEGEMTDAARRLADQTLAEGTRRIAVGYRQVATARLQLAGGDGFQADAEVVQASRPGEPGVERGDEDALAVVQERPDVRQGKALEEVLGGDTGPGPEQSMEMVGADADDRGEPGEVGLLAMVFVEVAYDGGDAVVIVHIAIVSRWAVSRHPLLAAVASPMPKTTGWLTERPFEIRMRPASDMRLSDAQTLEGVQRCSVRSAVLR